MLLLEGLWVPLIPEAQKAVYGRFEGQDPQRSHDRYVWRF